MPITHNFVSPIADDPTAASNGEVLPSHWNAEHDVTIDTSDILDGAVTAAKTDAGVQASLALADSAVQPGDNVSALTNDSGFITSVTYSNNPAATGANNEVFGSLAGDSLTSGSSNVFFGTNAGKAGTNLSDCTAVGKDALRVMTSGFGCTAIGSGALEDASLPDYSTCIGGYAGQSKSGSQSDVYIGYQSGDSGGSSTGNTCIGYQSGKGLQDSNYNVTIGYRVCDTNTTGDLRNILIGYDLDLPSSGTDDYLNIGGLLTGAIHSASTKYLDVQGELRVNSTYTFPTVDGEANQVLITDGAGTLGWGDVSVTPAGSNTQVQFNDGGALGGDANFVWDKTNDRLGIGTSSPQQELEVVGTFRSQAKGPSDNIFFEGYNSAGLQVGVMAEASSGGFGGMAMQGYRPPNAGGAGFFFNGISGGNNTQAVTFQASSGTIGNLSAWNGTAPAFLFSTRTGPTTGNNIIEIMGTGETRFNLSSASAKGIIVKGAASQTANLQEWRNSSGTALAVVNASGNLGIGTASPTQKLHIVDSGLVYSLVESTGSAATYRLKGPSGEYGWYTGGSAGGDFSLFDYNSSARRMTITTSGNVGIGTVTPGAKLQVDAGSASTKGVIVKAAASQTANIQEWQNNSGTVLSSVDASGNLGIGTASPQFDLDIYRATAAHGVISNGLYPLMFGSDSIVGAFFGLKGGKGASFAAAGDLIPISINSSGVTTYPDINSALGRSNIRWGGLYTTDANISARNSTSKALVVKAAASQTANLQEWQNSSGTIGARIDSLQRYSYSTQPCYLDGSSGQWALHSNNGLGNSATWTFSVTGSLICPGPVVMGGSVQVLSRSGADVYLQNNTGSVHLRPNSTQSSLQADTNTTAGETRLLLWNNATSGMTRVVLNGGLLQLGAQSGTVTLTDDIEITDSTKGVILKSPDGTRWRITVDNSGALTTTSL